MVSRPAGGLAPITGTTRRCRSSSAAEPGKEGRGVTVLTHAEKQDVEPWWERRS